MKPKISLPHLQRPAIRHIQLHEPELPKSAPNFFQIMKNPVFWDVCRLLATYLCRFLACGFFYPEDGGDTFLRNVGSHKIYTAPHPRRRHSSYSLLWNPQILLFQINFNGIFLSTLKSHRLSRPFRHSDYNFVCLPNLTYACYKPSTFHP
jgi:hypothetical protein